MKMQVAVQVRGEVQVQVREVRPYFHFLLLRPFPLLHPGTILRFRTT
jgi:hypothetical protein